MTSRMPEREGRVPLDVVLSALAHEERRAIFRSLDRADGDAMALDALVERVMDQVRDDGMVGDEKRRRDVQTALHHVHLPKLQECRLIELDDTDRVRLVGDELAREILALVDPDGVQG